MSTPANSFGTKVRELSQESRASSSSSRSDDVRSSLAQLDSVLASFEENLLHDFPDFSMTNHSLSGDRLTHPATSVSSRFPTSIGSSFPAKHTTVQLPTLMSAQSAELVQRTVSSKLELPPPPPEAPEIDDFILPPPPDMDYSATLSMNSERHPDAVPSSTSASTSAFQNLPFSPTSHAHVDPPPQIALMNGDPVVKKSPKCPMVPVRDPSTRLTTPSPASPDSSTRMAKYMVQVQSPSTDRLLVEFPHSISSFQSNKDVLTADVAIQPPDVTVCRDTGVPRQPWNSDAPPTRHRPLSSSSHTAEVDRFTEHRHSIPLSTHQEETTTPPDEPSVPRRLSVLELARGFAAAAADTAPISSIRPSSSSLLAQSFSPCVQMPVTTGSLVIGDSALSGKSERQPPTNVVPSGFVQRQTTMMPVIRPRPLSLAGGSPLHAGPPTRRSPVSEERLLTSPVTTALCPVAQRIATAAMEKVATNASNSDTVKYPVSIQSLKLDVKTMETFKEYNIVDAHQIPGFQPIPTGIPVWKAHKLKHANRDMAKEYADELRQWGSVPQWKRTLIEKRLPKKEDHGSAVNANSRTPIIVSGTDELTAKLQRQLKKID